MIVFILIHDQMKTQLNIMFLLLAGNCSFAQPVVTYPNGGETLSGHYLDRNGAE